MPLGDRLDQLVALHQSAYRPGRGGWTGRLRPPAEESALRLAEAHIGRLLPEEARDLYRWHDGCGFGWLAPDLSFPPLELALGIYKAASSVGRVHPLTNAAGEVGPAELFPIFDVDRQLFSVMTRQDEQADVSPIVVLLHDDLADATVVATSISAVVERLINEFEAGNIQDSQYGPRWIRDPFRFAAKMEPI